MSTQTKHTVLHLKFVVFFFVYGEIYVTYYGISVKFRTHLRGALHVERSQLGQRKIGLLTTMSPMR